MTNIEWFGGIVAGVILLIIGIVLRRFVFYRDRCRIRAKQIERMYPYKTFLEEKDDFWFVQCLIEVKQMSGKPSRMEKAAWKGVQYQHIFQRRPISQASDAWSEDDRILEHDTIHVRLVFHIPKSVLTIDSNQDEVGARLVITGPYRLKHGVRIQVTDIRRADSEVRRTDPSTPLTLQNLIHYARTKDPRIDWEHHSPGHFDGLGRLQVNSMVQVMEAIEDTGSRQTLNQMYHQLLKRDVDWAGIFAYQPWIYFRGAEGEEMVREWMLGSDEYRSSHSD